MNLETYLLTHLLRCYIFFCKFNCKLIVRILFVSFFFFLWLLGLFTPPGHVYTLFTVRALYLEPCTHGYPEPRTRQSGTPKICSPKNQCLQIQIELVMVGADATVNVCILGQNMKNKSQAFTVASVPAVL